MVLAVCGGLMLAVFGLYAQTRNFEYVSLDDYYLLVLRPEVSAGLGWDRLRWALTAVEPSWQPFTWLTHQLDFSLFGVNAGPPHLVNAGWHALNGILFFLALRALSGESWPSAFAAALFVVHPLRAESVAWLSERKDVTSGFFWMLGLLAYASYARRGGVWRYLLVVAALVIGLTAKTMVMTLPLVLLLLDIWPLGRWSKTSVSARALVLEKAPLVAISIAALGLTIFAQSAQGSVRSISEVSIGWRLVNVPISCVTYLAQMVWPLRLAATYPHPAYLADSDFSAYVWSATAAVIALGILTALCVNARRSAPYLMVGWLWYVAALVPVIGLLQVGGQGHADRYTYIPMLGVAVMIAWTLIN